MDELDKKLFNDLSEKVEIPVKCEYVIKNAFNNNAKKSKNSIRQILSTIKNICCIIIINRNRICNNKNSRKNLEKSRESRRIVWSQW